MKAILILVDIRISNLPVNYSVLLMCSEGSSHPGFFGQKNGSYSSNFQGKRNRRKKKKQEQIQLQAFLKGIFLSTPFLMCQKRTEKILTNRIIPKYSYFCTKIYQVLHKTVLNICIYSFCILEIFLFEKCSYIVWLKSLRYLYR